MLRYYTSTSDETFSFGREFAQLLQDGDILCLSGDLGAGKTLLAQGIAAGLGIEVEITSPTFTVLDVYQGRYTLYHYDWYRLAVPEELQDIGFEEYSGVGSITLIEWADKFPSALPDAYLWIILDAGPEPNSRSITLKPQGGRYETLLKEWTAIADTRFRHDHAGI
ncbi:tRNA (adenosine(37)-N6)-threonylcarbamoyltransferase complex ATPase subunit type 1 TsaE [Acetonema longum]|uniref:tRNA threonylcarbamoyladenosine biosynthesis protein TsaE n=1 Tax=Acetonema longum DSM 6540 TaxID=1009370 RepID=F7NI51_9FIRM|nr:tRNA (adenosine(37)-N6)-threonylcarbamoyltransferase complex ATPase subunit type 1 TsaE [Acetonema longum]EGO64283.1 ATPase or kinase [Acetonema longum DSM 6540]